MAWREKLIRPNVDKMLAKGDGDGVLRALVHDVAAVRAKVAEAVQRLGLDAFDGTPILDIKGYVIVRDSDYQRARGILYTIANVRERLPERVRIVKLAGLTAYNFATMLGAVDRGGTDIRRT